MPCCLPGGLLSLGTALCIPCSGRTTALLSARAGAVLVVIHALESPAGRVPRYFYSYGGKMAFSGPQSLRAPFPGVDDVFLARGRKVNSGNWRDVLLFTVGALLLLTSSSRPGITMFWLSGGTNYAWSAAIWLGFLCLYRSLWAGTSRIRDTPFSWLWIGVMAFAAGMTNENQIPASLGMLFVYWFYARCRGMVLPRWFSLAGDSMRWEGPFFCWLRAMRPAFIRRRRAAQPFSIPGGSVSVPFRNW